MKNIHDNQTLYSYLLGSLLDEDTERLDEMTFTDPVFADLLNAAEKDLVDSYVNGELSGNVRERFESYYMTSPMRRQNVLFASTLQEFAGNDPALSRTLVAGETRSRKDKTGFFESLAAGGGGFRAFQFAAVAAVIVLVVGAGWLLIRSLGNRNGDEIARSVNQNSVEPVNRLSEPTVTPSNTKVTVNGGTNLKPEIPQSSPATKPTPKPPEVQQPQPVIAAITLLPSLRGGQKLAQLKLTPETTRADFAINLESADYAAYRIELIDQGSGKKVWQASSVKARGKGGASSLHASIPANLLRSNIYSFVVSGIANGGNAENIGDYPFRVVR